MSIKIQLYVLEYVLNLRFIHPSPNNVKKCIIIKKKNCEALVWKLSICLTLGMGHANIVHVPCSFSWHLKKARLSILVHTFDCLWLFVSFSLMCQCGHLIGRVSPRFLSHFSNQTQKEYHLSSHFLLLSLIFFFYFASTNPKSKNKISSINF